MAAEIECPECGGTYPLDRDLLRLGAVWAVCPHCMTLPDPESDPTEAPAENAGCPTDG